MRIGNQRALGFGALIQQHKTPDWQHSIPIRHGFTHTYKQMDIQMYIDDIDV